MDQKRELLQMLNQASESIEAMKMQILNSTCKEDIAFATILTIDVTEAMDKIESIAKQIK